MKANNESVEIKQIVLDDKKTKTKDISYSDIFVYADNTAYVNRSLNATMRFVQDNATTEIKQLISEKKLSLDAFNKLVVELIKIANKENYKL